MSNKFVYRNFCSNGHSLTEFGYVIFGMKRCRLCASKEATRQTKLGNTRWRKLREKQSMKV